MTKITYEPAQIADLDDIMRIEEKSFAQNETLTRASMLERIRLIPDSFIVARNDESRIIGFISGPVTESRYLSDECFEHSDVNPVTGGFQKVISLAIDTDYQGMGIATELLLLLEQEARAKKRQGISLTCHDYLIPYYEKHGFANEGLSDSHLGGETWFNMVLTF